MGNDAGRGARSAPRADGTPSSTAFAKRAMLAEQRALGPGRAYASA